MIPAVALSLLTKLRGLPWKLISYGALLVLAFTAGVRWEAKKFEAYKAQEAIKVAALEKKAAEITTVEVTKYVDRIKVVREKGDTVIQKVPIYVPRDVCLLPGGFRSLHDYAATNRELPESPGTLNAAPVDAQDAATTIAQNYATCHATEEQLIALQAWVRAQSKLKEKHGP